MRRYTKVEKVAAVAGAVLMIFGILMIARPTTMTLLPENRAAYNYFEGTDSPVHISKSGSQVIGVLCVITGVGISWLALFTYDRLG